MNTLKNIKIYMIDKNVYYKNSKEEIAINNLRLLKIFSIIAFAIYSAYYIFTYIFFRDHIINSFYLISLPIFLIFFIFALVYEKMNKIKFSVVQIISALFCVSLLVLITALSVFFSATTPSIFMAIVIMLLPLLFIFRTEFMHSLIIVAELAFIILCLIFKEPEAYIHDFFQTISACIFAFIITELIYSLRVNDFRQKSQYLLKSNIDGLTNVYNKMYTENESASYLNAHSETSKNAMLIIDIDNFKDINDTLGHISGDNFLRLFGEMLNELIPPPNICGRIGGDEFLILLKNIDNLHYAEKKASEIMAKVNGDIFLEVNKKITCSIGIAFVSNKFVSFFELYQLSDTALYRAKKLGRNRFISYKAVATIKDNDKKLMLIADDSSINRIVLKQTFKNEYNIVEASDGEETLSVINQYSGKISVILLDIRMPKINGFEILEYLRTKPDLSRIPTLVVTSDATLEEKCLELGSSDIIIKPIEPNIAKLRVKNAVNNWKPS